MGCFQYIMGKCRYGIGPNGVAGVSGLGIIAEY